MQIEWVQLIGAFGLGTLAAKLMDVFLLQKRIEQKEQQAWLRNNRLEAFSDVMKEFLSFGLHEGEKRSAFQTYASVSKALLLIEDASTIEKLEKFIFDLTEMNSLTDSTNPSDKTKGREIYNQLNADARDIQKTLRDLLNK